MQKPNQSNTALPKQETAQPEPEADRPEPQPVPRQSRATCFRISGIPPHWDIQRLEKALRTIDPEFDPLDAEISGPFPDSSDSTLTALLNLSGCTPYFTFERSEEKHEVVNESGRKVRLVLDKHFYDLTPLNRAKEPIQIELATLQEDAFQILTCTSTA